MSHSWISFPPSFCRSLIHVDKAMARNTSCCNPIRLNLQHQLHCLEESRPHNKIIAYYLIRGWDLSSWQWHQVVIHWTVVDIVVVPAYNFHACGYILASEVKTISCSTHLGMASIWRSAFMADKDSSGFPTKCKLHPPNPSKKVQMVQVLRESVGCWLLIMMHNVLRAPPWKHSRGCAPPHSPPYAT